MPSPSDLSMSPDVRYLRFRESYTTNENLVSLHDDLMSFGALNATGFKIVHDDINRGSQVNAAGFSAVAAGLGEMSGQLEGMTWAIEDGFNALAEAQYEVARITQEGFKSLSRQFHWGLARIAHEMELNRAIYQDIRKGILYPAATQGREYRERAETALENSWWDEAVTNLQRALAENPMDFLAHYHLGHVLWFQHGQGDAAMEQFQLAAKYADTKRTDENQRYYAAIAHVHISLLWRMHADAYPNEAAEANRKAYEATKRAVELQSELSMARAEHATNAMRCGTGPTEARDLIRTDTRRDKNLLSAYRVNPELKRFPKVAEWVNDAGRTIESIPEERERLRQEAERAERARQEREAAAARAAAEAERREEESAQRERERLESIAARRRAAGWALIAVGVAGTVLSIPFVRSEAWVVPVILGALWVLGVWDWDWRGRPWRTTIICAVYVYLLLGSAAGALTGGAPGSQLLELAPAACFMVGRWLKTAN